LYTKQRLLRDHLVPHTQRHLPTTLDHTLKGTLDHTLKGICQQPWTTHSKASINNLRPHTQRHLGPHTQRHLGPHTQRHLGPHTQRHLPTTLDHTLKGICQQPWTTHSRASVNNLGPLTADPPTCNAGTGGCWLMCSEIHIYEAETIEQMHALTWPLHVKCGHRWVVADLLHEHVRAI